jgi:hypothetical protein
MAQTTDHLGRTTATPAPRVQTVTGFAVEQGTLEKDAPGVQEALQDEKRRAEQGTERAERVARLMAPVDDPTPVPAEEGGGQG